MKRRPKHVLKALWWRDDETDRICRICRCGYFQATLNADADDQLWRRHLAGEP